VLVHLFFSDRLEVILKQDGTKINEMIIRNVSGGDLSIIDLSFNGGQRDCKPKKLKPSDPAIPDSDDVVLPMRLQAGASVQWIITCPVGRVGIATDMGSDEYAFDAENARLIINPDTRYRPGQKKP